MYCRIKWILMITVLLAVVWNSEALANYVKTKEITWKDHVVEQGETLSQIAQKHEGVTVDDICDWNGIKDKDHILAGQPLVIKKKKIQWKIEKKISSREKLDYRVQKGDTLAEIGNRFGVSVEKIMNWNPEIKSRDLIYVDQELTLYTSDHRSDTIDHSSQKRVQVDNGNSQGFGPRKKRILQQVEAETGVNWEVLYGLCKKESDWGRVMVGDNGRAFGWFQIHRGYHPQVKVEQAMDFEWSARWAADYLVELGYFESKFRALRKYNGSLSNHVTARRAKQVMKYAQEVA